MKNCQKLVALIFMGFYVSRAFSVPIVFPSGSGVIDVTMAPYNADKTGKIDATAAIQKALNDYPNKNRIIFLPEGTYTVSDRIDFGYADGANTQKRTRLMGAGKEHTILKLAISAPLYDSAAVPRAMIWTGTSPAQRFSNEIMHLTVHTNGHAGAIGIQFNSSNQGSIEDVLITSGVPGKGKFGVDMGYTDEIGPLLVNKVTVDGFETGIRTFWQVNSMTLENITLLNQSVYGIHNYHQIVSIRNLDFTGSVPAIFNQKDANGVVSLIDCTIRGTGAAAGIAAIHNQKDGFFRNLTVSGFALAVNNDDKGRDCGDLQGPTVPEAHSHCTLQKLFDSGDKTLNLQVKQPPQIPWFPLEDWASVDAFGALGNNVANDTKAVRDAIASGKKIIYFTGGKTYRLSGTITVSGPVRRICGLRGNLMGDVVFKVVDSGAQDAPEVIFDGIRGSYTSEADVVIEHASGRTVFLTHCAEVRTVGTGSGDFFMSDVVCDSVRLRNPAQSMWCRQLNLETESAPKIINNGAKLWVLGVKTERGNIVVKTIGGGKTEILGGHIYSTSGEKVDPMFEIIDASFSAAGIAERNFNGNPYQTWIQETRGTQTKTLAATNVARRGNFYYTGYDPGIASSVKPVHRVLPEKEDKAVQRYSLHGKKFGVSVYAPGISIVRTSGKAHLQKVLSKNRKTVRSK